MIIVSKTVRVMRTAGRTTNRSIQNPSSTQVSAHADKAATG